ncbi:hypothetical protein PV11_01059 [Exophiala sideris]|uniref:Uncharacterized protein n=1 Tax=Exophiala sideris TaxID=1016849 RepID=A0A0D1ZF10_9EURO|nr:hypothetical protein PV11_01059 [Exophiala sideris]
MILDTPQRRKRISNMREDLLDCGNDLSTVLMIESECEASGRGSSLAGAVRNVRDAVLSVGYRLIGLPNVLGHFDEMKLDRLVRSLVHLAENILDQSIQFLKCLERRRFRPFLVAAGHAVRRKQSDHQFIELVDNIRDKEHEFNQGFRSLVDQHDKWIKSYRSRAS